MLRRRCGARPSRWCSARRELLGGLAQGATAPSVVGPRGGSDTTGGFRSAQRAREGLHVTAVTRAELDLSPMAGFEVEELVSAHARPLRPGVSPRPAPRPLSGSAHRDLDQPDRRTHRVRARRRGSRPGGGPRPAAVPPPTGTHPRSGLTASHPPSPVSGHVSLDGAASYHGSA